MSVFPLRGSVEDEEREPRVVDIATEDADAVFDALGSDTARGVYALIAEEPRTASDIAEELDSSIQNVRYHLDKLQDAGLVDVVDTWYSSRGSEMSVYGATEGPLVLFAGEEAAGDEVGQALRTLGGGTAVLAVVGLLINYLTRDTGGGGAGPSVMDAGGEAAATGLEWMVALPGLLFALGGLVVLVGVTAYLVATAR